MVQMSPPGQVPFAFPPPPFVRPPKKKQDKPSSADNKTSLAVDKAAPSAIDKAKARDKAPSQSLPGAFFRGMKKRNSSDSTTTAAGSDSGANGNGKSKTSKGRAAAPSTKNKPDLNKGSEMVETEYINAFSPSGMEITTLFEDYPLGAPRDITQKALWERLLDDEVSSRILKLNRRVVSAELKRNRVRHSAGAIKALDQILRRQVCNACIICSHSMLFYCT